MNILVVDDEKEIADLVELFLKNEGFTVYKFYDSKSAVDCIFSKQIDLALLDVMIDETDGFSILRKIREQNLNFPSIMLTAKVEDSDKILGLSLGADDYITKPFNVREVISRIKAILRRVNPKPKENQSMFISGDITLDYNFRRAVIKDKTIELTGKEFDLLELFVKNPGKVYTRENLLDIAWGFDYLGDVRTVDVHIRRLREKIEENSADPKYIKTKWGVGYYYKKD